MLERLLTFPYLLLIYNMTIQAMTSFVPTSYFYRCAVTVSSLSSNQTLAAHRELRRLTGSSQATYAWEMETSGVPWLVNQDSSQQTQLSMSVSICQHFWHGTRAISFTRRYRPTFEAQKELQGIQGDISR